MKVLFIASFSPIVADAAAARKFYIDDCALPIDKAAGDYAYADALDGVKHLGLWPLAEAAEACFGAREWPKHLRVPQASLELEVDDVAAAAAELAAKGHELLHGARTEPWGQTVARLLSPDGLVIGLSHTPSMH